MKKPSMRVTQWLGEIPIEAGCTSCPDELRFNILGSNKKDYEEKLQRAFDRHFEETHGNKKKSEKRPTRLR